MTAKKLLVFSVLLLCQLICAQQNTIALDVVNIADSQLHRFSATQSVANLNDSILRHSSASLSDVLSLNTTIYFKQNGNAMVSSPSFRGTTAQQTAVIWNGININSQFNGQTDFSAVTTSGYNNIKVRAGGGSAIYGSSAIGGSIHLNNVLEFGNKSSHDFRIHYGSFNTQMLQYHIAASSERLSVQAGFTRNSSDNDFEFRNKNKNTNAQYFNNGFRTAFGYKLNANNTLRFYSNIYDGSRHFALLSLTDTKTKYLDSNVRNLLEWVSSGSRFTSTVKAAFLTEKYEYIDNLERNVSTGNEAETAILKYDAAFILNGKMLLNAIVDLSRISGSGTDIKSNTRDVGAAALLLKHQLSSKFSYEASIRNELASDYKSPVLFSAGAKYQLGDGYSLRANVSRNYRIPTFNDLYWSDGGNPNLKPESSYQGELGSDFNFKNGRISLTGYYIKINDMIQWLPGTTASWLPRNVNKVQIYGGEFLAHYKMNLGSHKLAADATYAYTISQNEQTGKQLIYVPIHKSTLGASYSYRNLSLVCQTLFAGEVFTRSDNNPRYNVDSYFVSQLSAHYIFKYKNPIKVGVQVANVFDVEYDMVERREAPGRHLNMYLHLNF